METLGMLPTSMVCDAVFHHNGNPWRLPAMYATLQLMETIIHVSAALTYGDYRPCESSFDCGQRRVRPAPLMETTVHVNRTLADGDYH